MIVRCPRCRVEVDDRQGRCAYCSAALDRSAPEPVFAPAPPEEEAEEEPEGPVCQRCGSADLGPPDLSGALLLTVIAAGVGGAAYALLQRVGPARLVQLPADRPEITGAVDFLLVAGAAGALFGLYRFVRLTALRISGARFCQACGARFAG